MKARGTTLLETLIALAATAVLIAGLGGSVLAARTARARAAATADRIGTARTALLRLAAELERARTLAIVPPTPDAPLGAPALRLGDAPEGTVVWRVQADGDAAALAREADAAPCAAPDPAPAGALPVVDGLRGFRLRAFDGEAWRAAWDTRALPRAVEVALAVDDGRGGVEELGTVVTLPAAGGPS